MASTTTIGDTPPSSPAVGDAWWDSAKGQLYVWFNDGSSSQWVVAHNQPGRDGPPGPPGTSYYAQGPGGPSLPTPAPLCDGGTPTWLSPDATWEQLYDNVQVQIPGVTTDNVVMQSWNTVYDFYISSTYRREHVYWCMSPGINTLNFDPWDSHWRVFRFLGFRGLSRPKFEPPGRIRDLQYPVADTTRDGEVVLALRPIDINTPLGDDFWAMWFDPVCDGVLSRLYLQPGKPYSDLNMGRLKAMSYSKGVQQARAHVQSMFVTDGIPWRYPYFAYGRSKNGGWGGPG
jgi:hypothetical protein